MTRRSNAIFTQGTWLLLGVAACGYAHAAAPRGDSGRAEAAINRYGCVACHTIPGIASPGSNVGPPLTQIASRAYIAGVLPNTRANMQRWIREPQQVDPRSAMPDMGVTEQDARDISAYLYTLK